MSGRWTDALAAAHGEAWRAATGHRFVRDLGADTLTDAVFRRYLVQDFAFIDALVTALGYAIAKARTLPAKRRLAGFLAAVTGDETNYFERALTALDAADAFHAPERVVLAPATARFRDLLAETGARGSYAEILAVIVPAEWVYLTWATACPRPWPERFQLREWIALHALPAFAEIVDWLRSELDASERTLSAAERIRIEELFAATLDLERAFFDSAYAG